MRIHMKQLRIRSPTINLPAAPPAAGAPAAGAPAAGADPTPLPTLVIRAFRSEASRA